MEKLYKRTFLTILLSTLLLVSAKAQVLEDVANNIRSANVPGLTKYFDKIVAITMNNNQATYSGAQAEMVLKDFYSKNTVKDFVIMQSGVSGSNSKYVIGKLTTTAGTYQLYIVLKMKDEKYMLHEMRFEK
ncbi:MAG: DUF4783 domain-containing protein [Sphingobacteriales bacterium]|nr:MAG: DUF4783 domain-containing protein [Sphingobacteriales bacterium]